MKTSRIMISILSIGFLTTDSSMAHAQTAQPGAAQCPAGYTLVLQAAPTGMEQLEGRPLKPQEAAALRERLAYLGDATVPKCVPTGSQTLPPGFAH